MAALTRRPSAVFAVADLTSVGKLPTPVVRSLMPTAGRNGPRPLGERDLGGNAYGNTVPVNQASTSAWTGAGNGPGADAGAPAGEGGCGCG